MPRNLVIDGERFILWVPELEEEQFHPIIKEHAKDIFGKDTAFVDISPRLKSSAGIGSEPDGFAIDPISGKLYVTEIELSKHDPYSHIRNQLTRFMDGLDEFSTKMSVVDALFDEINATSTLKAFFDEKVKENLHRWLSKLLNKTPAIVVIIEERTRPVEEACKHLGKIYETNVLEFQTFRKENSPDVHAHLFESLISENKYQGETPKNSDVKQRNRNNPPKVTPQQIANAIAMAGHALTTHELCVAFGVDSATATKMHLRTKFRTVGGAQMRLEPGKRVFTFTEHSNGRSKYVFNLPGDAALPLEASKRK